ncbi:MAG TPA: protein kinase [Gemmatimonadaceae bacterium]|nr:protein kinase [Gemmatimonadaceae bacterium]
MPEVLAKLREALAGRYEIERELGRGGMATVYLARDVQHDRPVAVKVLHPDLAASLGAERFQREIKLAAGLQHPHILGVYDSGNADGNLWFTMPFVEGQSLRDRLNREGQLPINEAVRICREAALALDFAHRHGVVHRDIKPDNILLIDGQAMVADFGIARAIGASGGESLTQTGMSVGTAGYMSPEQATGESRIDARTDVYALGCVLYEMLAGEPPFTGPTAQAVIARAITETPRPLTSVRQAITPKLANAVSRALAKAPADRPATAGEFARDLESAVTVEIPHASVSAPSRNRLVGLGVGALIVVALAVAGVLWNRDTASATVRRIAVLPFENEGAAGDEYFADGMTDEVRSRLASITGIQVTARASSSQYKKTAKTPKDIGKELSVQYLLTGTVRWSKENGVNRVRVTPELIQVSNLASKWSQAYDTVLSNVFDVQSTIATQVAQALNVALAPPEAARLAQKPTTSLDAYDEFLKGEQITQSLGTSDAIVLARGLEHYAKAVALDSNFLQAWSAMARAASVSGGTGPTKELVEQARVAAERAVALAPDRPEAHLAMGAYLRDIKLDYEGAHQQYLEGLKRDPNNVELLGGLASIERTLGKFDDQLAHIKQAAALDPRSINTARRLAGANHDVRRYADELVAWDRALALAPTNLGIIQGKAFGFLSMGALDSVHALVEEKLKTVDTTALLVRFALYQETMWTLPSTLWPKIVTLSVKDFGGDKGHWGLKLGHTYRLMGDSARARAFGDTGVVAFEAQLKDFPERAQLHELRGRALALAGRSKEAIDEAEQSLKLRETSLDASIRPYVHFQVARILIQSGDYNRALDLLEPLLKTPASDVTPAYLRIDPTFKPLYGNPRFDRMAERK